MGYTDFEGALHAPCAGGRVIILPINVWAEAVDRMPALALRCGSYVATPFLMAQDTCQSP